MKITICEENDEKFHLPREISRTGYFKIYQVIVSVGHVRNFDDFVMRNHCDTPRPLN